MIRHRYIHKICISAMIAAVILTILFMQGESLGIQPVSSSPEYESRLFDDSRVHTIDLQIDDWNCLSENGQTPASGCIFPVHIPLSDAGNYFPLHGDLYQETILRL